MNSLIAALVWDEARFGLALDLERFMIVAVERLQHGRDGEQGPEPLQHQVRAGQRRPPPPTTTSPPSKAWSAHEYFHNWTGNRITCRDWFQLSLKEGLTVFRDQEFSMDMAGDASARAVKRIEDVRKLRTVQFPEDAGSMAHPVRPDSYVAINNFYTPTVYEKGAEVVRMMHTLVGRDGFAKGMALYFQRHDGQAVTCDDFAQAIADANPGSVLARAAGRLQALVLARRHAAADGARPLRRRRRSATRCSCRSSWPLRPARRRPPLRDSGGVALFGGDGQALPLQLADEAGAARPPNACWCWTSRSAAGASSTSPASRCRRCCAASPRRWRWTTAWATPTC